MKIAFFIFIIFCSFNFAQIVTVRDASNNQPLELVTIYDKEQRISLITNAEGKADISSLKDGGEIIFSLIGYQPVTLSFNEIVDKNFILKMESTPVTLGQIIVSANKWEEEKTNLPNKIEIIGPQEVRFKNPQTAADMLGASGTVYIQKSQLGGGSPIIRGFSTNRLLLVVDGVRMNTAIFRSGNLQNVIALDANALENTEIIFGPGSVIYGSDAIGGVMHFHTLSPKISYSEKGFLHGQAFGRYSSAANEKTGHVHFNYSAGKWGFVTGATYTKFGDLIMGRHGPAEYLRPEYQDRINDMDTILSNPNNREQIASGYSQLNLMQKIKFKPDNNWELNYGFHYSTTTNVPRYDRLIQYRNNSLRYAEWFYGPQKWMMNHLALTYSASNKLYDFSKIIMAYQNFEESRHNRNFGDVELNHRTENVDAASINWDFIKKSSESSTFYYGLEAVFNKIYSSAESENILTNYHSPLSTRYPDGSTWKSYGAYLTYKKEVSSAFIFQSGIRYTLIDMRAEFDTAFSPFPFTGAAVQSSSVNGSAGVVWHPQHDWQINFNLSTGFRAPNIDDIGKVFDSGPGTVIVPNPQLKPEYAYNIDLGLIKSFAAFAQADLTFYYTYLDDALIRRDFLLNGKDSIIYDGTLSVVQAVQNAARAYVWGFQAGINLKLPYGFGFLTRFNYQTGKEEDEAGNIIPSTHTAPIFGIAELNYYLHKLKAAFSINYNGEINYAKLPPSERTDAFLYAKDESGNPFAPAWFTLNLKTSYSITDYLKINVGVENILDKRYRPYSSGITASGRNFTGSLRVVF